MKRFPRRLLCMTLAAALSVPPQAFVRAEDTDLFTGSPATSGAPNVLIIMDNSANWAAQSQHWTDASTQGQSELRALNNILKESFVNEGLNLGLMMLTPGTGTTSGWQNKDGAFVRFAMRPMNDTNKAALREMIVGTNPTAADPDPEMCIDGANSLLAAPYGLREPRNCIFKNASSGSFNESVGTNVDYSATMFEAFKYFGGYTNPAGAPTNTAGTPVDRSHFGPTRYSGNPDGRDDPAAYVNGLSGTRGVIGSRVEYIPPISADNACGKNYIIFIGNGFPTQDAPQSLLTGVGGDATQLGLPQVVTTTTTPTTTLGTRPATTCETAAACVTATQAQFGTQYDSYSCTGGTQINPVTFTDTVCRTQTQCEAQAPIDHPGYASYVCSGGTTSAGTTETATTTSPNTCESANACEKNGAAYLPGYTTYQCTGGDATGCKNPDKKNWTVTGTRTVGACTGGQNKINQTITATPANVCTGSNFLGQTQQGTKTVITVTFPANAGTAPPTGSEPRYADEWAKFLFQTDVSSVEGIQNVRTYTIDVFKDAQDSRQTRLLYNMAKVGGGKYFQATSESAIIEALRNILVEIQAQNSVFSAASLPVSATNRAQNENQVFFGMFRPDADARPRWYGNLKRYQVAQNPSTKDLFLADRNSNDAVALSTGFFSTCAESFWTVGSGTYWQNVSGAALQECPSAPGTQYSDLPDGPMVEKGGAAEVVRRGNNPPTTDTTPTYTVNRTMYTCTDTGSCPAATSPFMVTFDTANVSEAAVGVVGDPTAHANLINYIRGQDTAFDIIDEQSNGTTTDTRASIHGDVVHSRPLPVNHGGSTGVVIYYGGNDGPLRAVRSSDGKELWSFIAPEHHSRLKRLWQNNPLIKYPNVTDPSALRKDYFFDGTMGLFQTFDDSTTPPTVTAAWIFPAMRRGGRMIYGFDVTRPTAPTLKWRVGCPNLDDDTGCTRGYSGIGQTWSTPNVAFIKGFDDPNNPRTPPNAVPVIVVGGGYDNCEDTDSASPSCGGAKGRKVFVINADTGALLASFDTDRNVAADVTLIDRNFDGAVDHAYIADTGGNLYRIDFVNPSTVAPLPPPAAVAGRACLSTPTEWCITKIANTNGGDGRKFLFPPAAFLGRFNNRDIVILTVGSGDRERPLYTNYPFQTPVLNRFYAFVDLFSTNSSEAVNFDTNSSIVDITTTPANPCLPDIRGWRMDLIGGSTNTITDPRPGEQTVTSSLIAGGKVFFNTHRALQPAAGVCNADLGQARGYSVDLFCGSKFTVVYEGGGIPISPVLGTVALAGGSVVTFVIGAPGSESATNPYTPGQVTPVISPVRARLYWYRHGDK